MTFSGCWRQSQEEGLRARAPLGTEALLAAHRSPATWTLSTEKPDQEANGVPTSSSCPHPLQPGQGGLANADGGEGLKKIKFLGVQFSGIRHIYNAVRPSPLSTPKLFIIPNRNSVPLNTSPSPFLVTSHLPLSL